jgi:hypothetical protein
MVRSHLIMDSCLRRNDGPWASVSRRALATLNVSEWGSGPTANLTGGDENRDPFKRKQHYRVSWSAPLVYGIRPATGHRRVR